MNDQTECEPPLADGSRWAYDYNDRNELVSGRRFWADQTPVSGQQFEYAFDSIGNLKTNRSGGDVNGLNLRASAYTANSLNQYTAIGVPGYEDVIGVAHAGATVTVNGQSTDRKGEYYHCELSITNGSGPVWHGITATSTTNVTGKVLVPPASQTLTYDDDGNLTSDGLWTYVWDAENRLIQMTPLAAIPDAEVRRLNFAYDHLGRRIWKRVDYKVSGSWTTFYERKFIYDGWNLIAELWTTDGIVKKYLWGLDLSGQAGPAPNGAGGVGGLLKMWDYYTSKHYFAGYDGNGNVTVLVDAANQAVGAQYEYSPFGETLRATGPVAKSNPFRFSTKFTDQESDLVYYGYRYYSPSLMRWVNRDPIEEGGGVNLYGFLMNGPIAVVDPFGRTSLAEELTAGSEGAAMDAVGIGVVGAITLGGLREAVSFWNAGQIYLAKTDPNDEDWEEGLHALNISFAGQLMNNIPDPDDENGKRGIRRSSKGGDNQAQNKVARGAANEAGLNEAGRAQLKALLESIPRGGDKSPDYRTILEMAKELAKNAKYRS